MNNKIIVYYATRSSIFSRKWSVVYRDVKGKIHVVESNISNEKRAKEIAEDLNRVQPWYGV